MGTRSLTVVYCQFTNEPIAGLYGQYDGYPSGHGKELSRFLNNIDVGNGISGNELMFEFANGMDCLAAQLIVFFKREVGNYYMYNTNKNYSGIDYVYHVYNDRIEVFNGDDHCFKGSWVEFEKFCEKG